ncbi:MAG TPA: copper homeostasis protein CutC, partial [Saprospiraceae bacterium]|nr:copper homeostasis protein CutC [Saprospiraceae bacterium]
MKNYFLESCVTTFDDALHAANNGVHRIEICARLETEGMTPNFELVKSILEKIKIPVRVIIRETETGFDADEEALQKMI